MDILFARYLISALKRSRIANPRHRVSLNNPFKFNGKELDSETGLYYYGARYYDPRISLFISVDPLAEQTMTPYQYTYQNSINLVDPTGNLNVGISHFVRNNNNHNTRHLTLRTKELIPSSQSNHYEIHQLRQRSNRCNKIGTSCPLQSVFCTIIFVRQNHVFIL